MMEFHVAGIFFHTQFVSGWCIRTIFKMNKKHPNLFSNAPKDAGERLLILAQNTLNSGKEHGARAKLARMLYGDGNEYISMYSKVCGWCRGEFLDADKPLKVGDFQELINILWQQPGGIQTFDEIFDLARSIGYVKVGTGTGKLIDLLDRAWLENLGYADMDQINNSPSRDVRYPRNIKLITRRAFLDEINRQFIPRAMELKQPIIIFGEPGTGKTTLIDQIGIPKTWNELAEKRILFLNGQGLSAHLRAWYQELVGIEPKHGSEDNDLAPVISKRLAKINVPRLILMDDAPNVECISLMLDVLKNTKQFILIVTTNSPMVLQAISVPRSLQVHMPGFSTEEAETYFKIFLERKLATSEKKQFDLLVKTLKGNPLGLHFALQQLHSIGIEDLLKLLNGIDQEIPKEMLREIFLPLQVGFERLPDELTCKFIRLASMKRFYSIDNRTLAALWADSSQDVDFAKTKLNIDHLQKFISPLQSSQEGDGSWKLHEQTHLFSISKFNELHPAEKEKASNWINRLDAVYKYSEPTFSDALGVSKKLGIIIERTGGSPDATFLQKIQKMLARVFWAFVSSRDYDWEKIQQELTHITSYEYFVCNKLQQRQGKYLKNIRLWLLCPGLIIISYYVPIPYPNWFIIISLLAAYLLLIIYTIKIWVVDGVGLWKSLTQWQLIWIQTSQRLAAEDPNRITPL